MAKQHHYQATITWTGNTGSGTAHYSTYERSHTISVNNKPAIAGSSDPAFRGDAGRHNPEDLLLASLSSCHMLWYLHLCAANNVIVESYTDQAQGTMIEGPDGSGRFTEVVLLPVIKVSDASMISKAMALHEEANRYCFIANSVNFPVLHRPVVTA
ncbi:OsmC family protein [Polluticaenibacter yanchengensis]|uniref:OsmC family protein n=1 Tax=Polluticaenibacter yanchengensis TaxID=3014562 RepID=A0ABT4UKA0_9BACT|nr:OsmC family protein [Chitinophagaceae bacterium LY-5]